MPRAEGHSIVSGHTAAELPTHKASGEESAQHLDALPCIHLLISFATQIMLIAQWLANYRFAKSYQTPDIHKRRCCAVDSGLMAFKQPSLSILKAHEDGSGSLPPQPVRARAAAHM